jgi:hypothetical protein
MDNRLRILPVSVNRVRRAMGSALARVVGLCSRIETCGIEVSLIPGLLSWSINFRAGGSGRAHRDFRGKKNVSGSVSV